MFGLVATILKLNLFLKLLYFLSNQNFYHIFSDSSSRLIFPWMPLLLCPFKGTTPFRRRFTSTSQYFDGRVRFEPAARIRLGKGVAKASDRSPVVIQT